MGTLASSLAARSGRWPALCTALCVVKRERQAGRDVGLVRWVHGEHSAGQLDGGLADAGQQVHMGGDAEGIVTTDARTSRRFLGRHSTAEVPTTLVDSPWPMPPSSA